MPNKTTGEIRPESTQPENDVMNQIRQSAKQQNTTINFQIELFKHNALAECEVAFKGLCSLLRNARRSHLVEASYQQVVEGFNKFENSILAFDEFVKASPRRMKVKGIGYDSAEIVDAFRELAIWGQRDLLILKKTRAKRLRSQKKAEKLCLEVANA